MNITINPKTLWLRGKKMLAGILGTVEVLSICIPLYIYRDSLPWKIILISLTCLIGGIGLFFAVRFIVRKRRNNLTEESLEDSIEESPDLNKPRTNWMQYFIVALIVAVLIVTGVFVYKKFTRPNQKESRDISTKKHIEEKQRQTSTPPSPVKNREAEDAARVIAIRDSLLKVYPPPEKQVVEEKKVEHKKPLSPPKEVRSEKTTQVAQENKKKTIKKNTPSHRTWSLREATNQ